MQALSMASAVPKPDTGAGWIYMLITYFRPTPSPFTTSAGFSILTKWEIYCKLGAGLIELPVVERFGHGGYAIALNCKIVRSANPISVGSPKRKRVVLLCHH